LEDLKPDAQVRGLVGREAVRIVSAEMLGEAVSKVLYRGQGEDLGEQLLFRSSEADRVLVSGGRKWSLRAMANSTGCPECTTSRSSKAHA
jgi:hypothetical protein